MRIVLDLLPPSVLQQRERGSRRRALVGIPLLTAAAIAVIYLFLAYQTTQVRAGARETEALLVPLRPVAVRLAQLQAESDELEARRQRIQGVTGRPRALSMLLEDVGRFVPTNVWLQSMVIEGGTLTITGSARQLSAVALFATTLSDSRLLAGVEMRSIQQTIVGDQIVTQFQLVGRFR